MSDLKKQCVTFRIELPEAQSVSVSGDFCEWDPAALPLKKKKSGEWWRNVHLVPGRYEYRYVVDGEWVTDPENGATVPNEFGSENSVVVVKP